MNRFGDDLYKRRTEMGLSQRAFSNRVGMTQATITRIEAGRNPTLLSLVKISKHTDIKFSVRIENGNVQITLE